MHINKLDLKLVYTVLLKEVTFFVFKNIYSFTPKSLEVRHYFCFTFEFKTRAHSNKG